MAEGKDDKAKLVKIAKLIEAQRELVDRLDAITVEIDELLGGGVGIGQKLRRLETTYGAAWSARYGPAQQYMWNYAKDRRHLKGLLRRLDLDDIEMRMQRYLQSDDPFYIRARHSFPMFVASINAHVGEPAQGAGDGLWPVVDCKHAPRCTNEVEHTRKRREELRT
jgi:hypothetical protein